MIRKLGWPLLVALVFLALSIRAASLVDASPLDKYKPQSAEGRRYYKLGAKFIALKKFKLAVQAYKDGYLADDAPIFLYNIATTYRAAGQLQESIDYYKRFLMFARDPHPAVTSGINKLIEQLRTELAKREREAKAKHAAKPRPSPSPVKLTTRPAPVPEPWYSDGVGWALAAAGLVAGGVGLGLLSNASALRSDAKRELNVDTRLALEARADSRETTEIVLGLTGAAILTAGVVKLIITGKKQPRRPSGVDVAFSVNWVGLQGRF